jgi:predicted MPP superfamily phosphohydrolase
MKRKVKYKFSFNPKLFVVLQEVVLFFLVISPLLTYFFFQLMGISSGFLFYFILILNFLVSLVSIYEAFIEPRLFCVRHHVLNIKNLSKKFRIVFFTDMHIGPFKKRGFVKRVVRKVNSLRADIIFIGGDFTTAGAIHPSYLTPLKDLEANYPIIAVLGNHDYNVSFIFDNPNLKFAKKIRKKLSSLRVKILRNQSYLFDFGDEKLNVVGIDDLWVQKDDLDKAFKDVDPKWPVLVLGHNLDLVKKLRGRRVDILLAGHTHGLYLNLSLIGLINPPLRNTELKRRYIQGFNRYNGIPMFVSTGLGSVFNGMRFFQLPEIVIFDLK